jgi:hypothetical protein
MRAVSSFGLIADKKYLEKKKSKLGYPNWSELVEPIIKKTAPPAVLVNNISIIHAPTNETKRQKKNNNNNNTNTNELILLQMIIHVGFISKCENFLHYERSKGESVYCFLRL